MTWHFRVYRISLSICELDKCRDSSLFYSRNEGFQHYRGICWCGNGLLSICGGRVCAGMGWRFFHGTTGYGIRDFPFFTGHGIQDTGFLHFARDRGIRDFAFFTGPRDTGYGISHFCTGPRNNPESHQSRGKNHAGKSRGKNPGESA